MTQPETVEMIEHLWIPMPDGTRLAARMWLPQSARSAPVPAIFEYIPYRKADMVRARDERNHPFLAENGYAALRVDMRGSGDSDGHMPDMYDQNELDDARHVINWLAAQPWCNGKVGMFGTSWGGTASLQANVDAPEALKAVIAVCATHDRYDDDIHHMGGSLITDTFEWGATLPAILAAPLTPDAGKDWMAAWQQRLDSLTWPVENWVREKARGSYWRHGSVIHQADRLSRPILAVGGWSDRYSNSVMSLSEARPDLVWGVAGPWGHHYPDAGHPGPAIGFQHMALEWWDRWLKGTEAEWPKLRVWQREFDQPADAIDVRAGHWIETGPIADCTENRVWHLCGEGLLGTAPGGEAFPVPSDLRVGSDAGDTGYFGRFGGLPLDQSEADKYALTFDTPPLKEDLLVHGKASAGLSVSLAEPAGQILVRLSDIAPDGTAARVCFALGNLALSDSGDYLEAPADTPERSMTITLPSTSYRFKAGHRLRVSIGSSYWPLVWPDPASGGMTVLCGHVHLPVLKETPLALTKPFPAPAGLPKTKTHQTVADPGLIRTSDTSPDGTRTEGWHQPLSEVFYTDIQTSFAYETTAEFQAHPADPLTARSHHRHLARYSRPDGTAEITSWLKAASDAEDFHLTGELLVTWNGAEISRHVWDKRIPRAFGNA